MKRLMIATALVFLAVSCSSESTPDKSQENNQAQNDVAVIPNRVLTMEIDGMTCKMGCGGSIRKELKSTGAVATVDFDFEEERKTNVATISFDKSLITVDEMIQLISEMNDGQFTVGETSSESLDEVNTIEDSQNSTSEESTVEVSSSYVGLPNIFDILSGLFVQ